MWSQCLFTKLKQEAKTVMTTIHMRAKDYLYIYFKQNINGVTQKSLLAILAAVEFH